MTHRAIELAWLGCLALLWGSSYLLIKIAVQTIPPISLIAARVTIAAVFLMAVMKWQKVRFPRDRTTWRMLLVQAFLNSIGAWTVLAWGQQFVDSGLAGVLNSTAPIFVFFITLFWTRHETVDGLRLTGALLGLFGVILIVGVDVLRGLGEQVAGQFAVLLGAVLYAGAAINGQRFSQLPNTVTAAGTMICATVVLVPLGVVVDHPWTLSPSWQSLLALAVLAVFCTGLALLIYFRLLTTLGSMGTASQAYLRAGVSVFLGVTVLGEEITSAVGLGLSAVIIGVIAINARAVRP